MAKTKTFVDAHVLIWAARGQDPLSQAAMAILTSSDREFVASDFLRLEVIPMAAYHRQAAEEAFYRLFLDAAILTTSASPRLLSLAEEHATRYGLSAVDALHVAAAVMGNAEELVTAERPTSPLFRVKELRIASIRQAIADN